MKTLAFILASVLVAFTANISVASKLVIKTNYGHYTVMVDHNQITKTGSQFSFSNLEAGDHRVKIFKHHSGSHYYAPWKEVIYSGYIDIPFNSRVEAFASESFGLEITRIMKNNSSAHHGSAHNYHSHGNHGTNSHGSSYYTSSHSGNQCGTNAYYEPDPCLSNDLIRTIENASFDSDKLIIAKQAARSGRLRSSEVLRIMELMSFDSSKLKFAKYAYEYVVDPANYYIVNKAFTFSSSIDDLDRYISGVYL